MISFQACSAHFFRHKKWNNEKITTQAKLFSAFFSMKHRMIHNLQFVWGVSEVPYVTLGSSCVNIFFSTPMSHCANAPHESVTSLSHRFLRPCFLLLAPNKLQLSTRSPPRNFQLSIFYPSNTFFSSMAFFSLPPRKFFFFFRGHWKTSVFPRCINFYPKIYTAAS